jgi:hypothetical protein
MAWLIGDGFDFYANGANNDMTCPGNGCFAALNWGTTSATTRFGVGQSAIAGNAGTNFQTVTFANSTTVWINFAYYIPGAIGSDTSYDLMLNLRDTTNTQCCIATTHAGNIKLFSGINATGTQLAASTGGVTCPPSAWSHLQIKIVIDNAAGSMEIRVNGGSTPILLATGLNTRNGSLNNYFNNVTSTNSGAQPVIDDFYLFNDQAPAPLTWQGDIRAFQLIPNSDVSVTWNRSTGTSNFSCVDDLAENGDTDYVSTLTVNNVDQYGTTALPTVPNAIIGVVTKAFVRMDDVGPHSIRTRLTSNLITSDSAPANLFSSYSWVWTNYMTDPSGGGTWTAVRVNAATIGPFCVS